MAYRWHYTGASGPEVTFADQTEAEQWLEEHWPRLLEAGVDEVTLLDHAGAEVYGPMSLHSPGEPSAG